MTIFPARQSSACQHDFARACVVLHLDDDIAVNNSVRALLKIAGCNPVSARSSAEAIDQVLRHGVRPDVLVMDYRLAEETTGTDVAERIVRALGYPIPTILLTGDLANIEIPWMPGAPISLLAKPADPDLLLDTIQHFSALQRAAQARLGSGVPRNR